MLHCGLLPVLSRDKPGLKNFPVEFNIKMSWKKFSEKQNQKIRYCMYTNRWMIFAQSLLTDSQGIIQEICCIFVFVLVSKF